MSDKVAREEYRRFNCHRYKVLTDITYGYNEADELIYADCSLEYSKRCDGYERTGFRCPYRFPHSLKEH